MNSKNVLSKIMTLLSLDKEEILFTDAKLADGTILQSPTFDLGETVEVVSEDGTKTPAPDGEHEIALKDEEGNEVLIKIETKDGKITERENVELPTEEAKKEEEKMQDELPVDTMMAADYVKAPKGLETDEAHALPNTTDEDPRNRVGTDADDKKDPIIALSYRITELEDAIAELKAKFGEEKVDEVIEEVEPKLEEVEVKKLDGAPVEMSSINLSAIHKSKKNNEGNYQSSFLSKLYN
jgi:hypothetical protein